MELQLSTGAAQLILASVIPVSIVTRWVKTPHKKAHEEAASAMRRQEEKLNSLYIHLIPAGVRAKDNRDTL